MFRDPENGVNCTCSSEVASIKIISIASQHVARLVDLPVDTSVGAINNAARLGVASELIRTRVFFSQFQQETSNLAH